MFTRCALKETLKDNVVVVEFKKANGDIRKLKCTLKESLLPKFESKSTKKENLDILAAFDLEKNEWRSFRINSVISAEVIE